MGFELYQVVYDGGSIEEFNSKQDAFAFMDEYEDRYGYSFEYIGEQFNGVKVWEDRCKNAVMRF